jgi:hypothetical protein
LALAELGKERITDIAANTIPAQKARDVYAQTRDALLRSYNWNFAKAQAVLSEDTMSPAFHWDHAYILPSDFLRLVQVRHGEDYEIQGKRLLTDRDSAHIEYIRLVDDPTQFDALFTEVFILKLALRLAGGLTQDKGLQQLLSEKLRYTESKARMVNATENKRRGPITWREARRVNISIAGR